MLVQSAEELGLESFGGGSAAFHYLSFYNLLQADRECDFSFPEHQS